MEVKTTNYLPSILDKEIETVQDDKFGHIHFAKALFSIIETHTPPYSIGLLGKWGVGKSSIKKLCKKEFLKKHPDKYKVIDFNAWRYESQDIRRSLLKHLFEELSETKEEELHDKLYCHITELFKKEKTPKEFVMEIYDKYFWSSVQFLLIFGVTFDILFWLIDYLHLSNEWAKVILTTVFGACATSITRYVFSANGLILSRYINKTRVTVPIIGSEQFEKELKERLTEYQKENPNKKIIVFIDDLDRLSPEETVKGIDAVRIFLDLDNTNMIFIISCDEQHIANSISERYKVNETQKLLDTENERKFLDRVFQFRIEIPKLPNQSMIDFAEQLLNKTKGLEKLYSDIEKSNNYTISNILDILIPIEVNSPRTVIQILNTFLQNWWIASNREEKCETCGKESSPNSCNEDYKCLLLKDIITNKLNILAIISVLKIQFPSFYQDLMVDSRLLKAILWKFLNIKGCAVVLNRNLTHLLDNYNCKTKVDLDDYKFDPQYTNLQSYLSSIQRIDIPDDLRPFLMLLQDSLEMEIGSDSVQIYDALITTDKTKLYDSLGITEERKILTEIQTKQLYKIRNQIDTKEIDERKKRAHILLANIADLFYGDSAYSLTNDLCAYISESKIIESIEMEDVSKILLSSYITNSNINNIFEEISSNLTDTRFMHAKQKESEQKLINFINIGNELGYNNKKLSDINKNRLINALQKREYFYHEIVDKKTDTKNILTNKFSIKRCFEWIDKYGPELTIDLGIPFVSDLLNEIEKDKAINITASISYFETILNDKKNDKECSINYLRLISQSLSSKNEFIIEFAISYIDKNKISSEVDNNIVDEIINAYIQRLIKHTSKDANYKLTKLDFFINKLIDLLTEYGHLISDKDTNSSVNLIELILRLNDLNLELLEKLIDISISLFPKILKSILEDWCKKIFVSKDVTSDTILNDKLLSLIANKYISTNEIESLSENLSTLFEDSEIDIEDANINRYEMFISYLDGKALSNPIIINHLSNMYAALEYSLENGYEDYFKSCFPILINLFDIVKDANLDSLLLYISTNYFTSAIDKTEELYKLFTDKWPHIDSEKLPNYAPFEIAKKAEVIIEKTANEKIDKKIIYKSIISMYNNQIINNDDVSKKLIVGCLFDIWKIDINFAYSEMQLFLDTIVQYFNYQVLALYSSSHKNKTILETLWKMLISLDSETNLTEKIKKFLINSTYMVGAFRPMWLKLVHDKYNNFIIFNNVITEIMNSAGDRVILLKDRQNLTKIILKDYNNQVAINLCKKLFDGYLTIDDGIQKHSLILWIRDLIGIDAIEVINHKTLKKSKNMDKDIVKLSGIFKANTYLTNKMKKLNKKKKTK